MANERDLSEAVGLIRMLIAHSHEPLAPDLLESAAEFLQRFPNEPVHRNTYVCKRCSRRVWESVNDHDARCMPTEPRMTRLVNSSGKETTFEEVSVFVRQSVSSGSTVGLDLHVARGLIEMIDGLKRTIADAFFRQNHGMTPILQPVTAAEPTTSREQQLQDLAHHLRGCMTCGDVDVSKCAEGRELWDAVMPACAAESL